MIASVASAQLPTVEVFVASRCPHCDELEDHLHKAGIPYRRIDLENDPNGERDYLENIGRGILPAARINGSRATIMRGFDPADWIAIERSIRNQRANRPPSHSIYDQPSGPSGELSSGQSSTDRSRIGRQTPPTNPYEQTRTTNDVRIQFVRQGNSRVAGIDGLEVIAAVSGKTFRTNTNQFGVAEMKEVPCDEDVRITAPGFAALLPSKTWEAKTTLRCAANSRETDMGAYSNFAGQKISDAKVNAIGLSRDVAVPEEFSDASVVVKREAANPKPLSPKEKEIRALAMLVAMGKPIDALVEGTPAYTVASACYDEMYSRLEKTVITKQQEKTIPHLARAYCACFIKGMDWDELTENAMSLVIQTLPFGVDEVIHASDAAPIQKFAATRLFTCVVDTDAALAK